MFQVWMVELELNGLKYGSDPSGSIPYLVTTQASSISSDARAATLMERLVVGAQHRYPHRGACCSWRNDLPDHVVAEDVLADGRGGVVVGVATFVDVAQRIDQEIVGDVAPVLGNRVIVVDRSNHLRVVLRRPVGRMLSDVWCTITLLAG